MKKMKLFKAVMTGFLLLPAIAFSAESNIFEPYNNYRDGYSGTDDLLFLACAIPAFFVATFLGLFLLRFSIFRNSLTAPTAIAPVVAVIIVVVMHFFPRFQHDDQKVHFKIPNAMHAQYNTEQLRVGEFLTVIFSPDVNNQGIFREVTTSTPSICKLESEQFGFGVATIRGISPGDCVVTGHLPATNAVMSASLTIHISILPSQPKGH